MLSNSKVWINGVIILLLKVAISIFLSYTVTACSPKTIVSIIDVSNQSKNVKIAHMPETKDLFGQVGNAYSIDSIDKVYTIHMPFTSTYDQNKLNQSSLFIAKYNAMKKSFFPLTSQVNLEESYVTANSEGSGIYTLFERSIGGADYPLDQICRQRLNASNLSHVDIRNDFCPEIICPNLSRGDYVENKGAITIPSFENSALGGLCDRCVNSFTVKKPTVCIDLPKQQPAACTVIEVGELVGEAELTQRGGFSSEGEICFVTGKTSLLKVAAADIAPSLSGVDLSNLYLRIHRNEGDCSIVNHQEITGFTFADDNETKIETVSLDKDVFFVISGNMLNIQGDYHFHISGKQGELRFGEDIKMQRFQRSGDITIITVPADAPFEDIEIQDVLKDLANLARSFPVRDGVSPSIQRPNSHAATGVMFYMAAPIPIEDLVNDRWGELESLRDEYNDSNIFDARLVTALLGRQFYRLENALDGVKGRGSSGGLSYGLTIGNNHNILSHEVGHNFGQVERESPNYYSGHRAHSINRVIGTTGYNLLKQLKVNLNNAASIMKVSPSGGDSSFFEPYEWQKLCAKMTEDDYVRFQSPVAAREIGRARPLSFSMVGSFDNKGELRVTRSYVTERPRIEHVAKNSDYHVIFSDLRNKELKRSLLMINYAIDEERVQNKNELMVTDIHRDAQQLKNASFAFVSSIPDNAVTVTIVKGTKVVAKIKRSKHKPQISEFSVNQIKTGEFYFDWDVEDIDSQNISASIFVSIDNGLSFQPITSNRKERSFKWKPQFISAGTPLLFELKVIDGFHSVRQRLKEKLFVAKGQEG